MSVLGWVLIAMGGWLLVAGVVGTVVGRVIRNRDRQVAPPATREQVDQAMQRLPTQRQAEGDVPGP